MSDFQTDFENRYEMDAEVLSNRIREKFGRSASSLKNSQPYVSEILRRFKHLPRKRKVDGTYPNIAGYRTFKLWCEGVLDKNDRTVRYMLKGGNKKRGSLKHRMETVSVLDTDLVMRYLNSTTSTADRAEQERLLQELKQFADELDVMLWKTRKGTPKNVEH